jgi:hypothetical protein
MYDFYASGLKKMLCILLYGFLFSHWVVFQKIIYTCVISVLPTNTFHFLNSYPSTSLKGKRPMIDEFVTSFSNVEGEISGFAVK